MNAEQLLEFIRTEAYNYEKATRQKPNTVTLHRDDIDLIIDYNMAYCYKVFAQFNTIYGMRIAETHTAIFKSKPSVTHTLNLK